VSSKGNSSHRGLCSIVLKTISPPSLRILCTPSQLNLYIFTIWYPNREIKTGEPSRYLGRSSTYTRFSRHLPLSSHLYDLYLYKQSVKIHYAIYIMLFSSIRLFKTTWRRNQISNGNLIRHIEMGYLVASGSHLGRTEHVSPANSLKLRVLSNPPV
jgi:hypothetical protein